MRTSLSIWDEMRNLQMQMDSLFENFFTDNFFSDAFFRTPRKLISSKDPESKLLATDFTNALTHKYKQPLSDIYETDKEVIAEIEMPGMNKKDIRVHVGDDSIDVHAETRNEIKQEDKKKGLYKLERNYSGFSRHFSLPASVDSAKANAEYKDGILRISVPKLKIAGQKKKLLEIK